MMNTQSSEVRSGAARGDLRVLAGGRILPLGSAGGKLEVLHGRVWLTRAGDRDDHFVDFGQSVVVPASGRALVESLDESQPAVVAWQPGTVTDRIGAALHAGVGRCWDIVDPKRRIGAGTVAAVIALVSGALLFGPLSDARTRSLSTTAVLHNSVVPNALSGAEARPLPKGPRADAGAESRERARGTAQEARRRAAGVA